VQAGQTYVATYNVYLAASPSTTNDLPSGTTGVLTLSATEWEKGIISDSASARITRHREPYAINIFNTTHFLRPNGDTAPLEFFVVDAQNVMVADGTQVQLLASTGVISPTIGTTSAGTFRATFTSGADLGTALITATTLVGVNGVTAASATTSIEIGNPRPNQIALSTSATQLPADGISTATLVATVRDRWDNPVPNQTVRIGVEGDGQLGTIIGGVEGEVITGTTDVNGQFSAVFTSGKVVAVVGVRAELLYDKGGGLEMVHDDRKEIFIGTQVYLPLLNR
jgi:Bacterial Ig-like domain (group 1)